MIKSKKADYKKVLLIFFILITLVIFSIAYFSKGNNDTVQIWAYLDERTYNGNTKAYFNKYINEIEKLCEENGINVEYNFWGEPVKKPISYNQYVLKRNISMTEGNAIIFSIINDTDLYDIKDMCMDYTTIDNYKNLWEPAQGKFYIPLYYEHITYVSDIQLFDSYDIYMNQSFLTFQEYLNKLGELVEKGADLRLNTACFHFMLEYYKAQNNIYLLDEDMSVAENKDMLSKGIANTICTMIEQIEKYKIHNNNDYINFISNYAVVRARRIDYNPEDIIYDYNTSLQIMNNKCNVFGLYMDLLNLKMLNENTFVYCSGFTPGILMYIYKDVTNDAIYDIANKVLYNIKFNNDAVIINNLRDLPKPGNEEFTLNNLEFI